jgi:hypothetical protein
MSDPNTNDNKAEDDTNQPKTKVRDFTPVISELRRKHELILSTWNALDAKIGILLGVTAIVLLEIIGSFRAARSLNINTGNLFLNIVLALLFLLMIGLFIYVIFIGLKAISVKKFKDIKTIQEVDNFIKNSDITNELFIQRLSSLLYDYIEINEKHRNKKARAVSLMIVIVSFGIALAVIRFIMLCCLF